MKPKSAMDQLSEGINPVTGEALPPELAAQGAAGLAGNQQAQVKSAAPASKPAIGAPGQTSAPATPTQLSASSVAGALGDPGLLGQLIQLMLLKEGREAAKEQAEQTRQAARQAQRDRNSREQDSQILLRQARCKHLKGGKKGSKKTQQKDFAVYQHTHIGPDLFICCQICNMKWRQGDTDEYLLRGKKKISNHTHIGWRKAVEMLDESSNTASSSEIPGMMTSAGLNFQIAGQALDGAGLPISPSVVDLEGNPVESVIL